MSSLVHPPFDKVNQVSPINKSANSNISESKHPGSSIACSFHAILHTNPMLISTDYFEDNNYSFFVAIYFFRNYPK